MADNNTNDKDTQDNNLPGTSADSLNTLENNDDTEEVETMPPEDENTSKGKHVNISIAIFAFIGLVGLAMILTIIMPMFNNKNDDSKDLDKAGSKYVHNFIKKQKEVASLQQDDITTNDEEKEITTIDEELEDKPQKDKGKELSPQEINVTAQSAEDKINQQFQQSDPGYAPVAPVGSTRGSGGGGSYQSDRPDTRNSRSPRSIEGLKGQQYIAAAPDTNANIIRSALFGGGYGGINGTNGNAPYSATSLQNFQNADGTRMTKEQYITRQLQQAIQAQQAQRGIGGGQAQQNTSFQQQRENFYNNGTGDNQNGQYLSYNSLWEGTIISGALITSINTDNPGIVIARITENVYSSYDHSFLLIPEGSLLYATYNSSISYGQNKVQVAWNLLIRPDGYRIPLGNMNGVSAQGVSGYKGFVNNHPWETLKALGMVAIYSVINTGVTKELKSQNNNSYSEYEKNAVNDVYNQMSKMGNKMLDRALDIKPTITIHSGKEIKLITNTTLELPPVQLTPVTRQYIRTR